MYRRVSWLWVFAVVGPMLVVVGVAHDRNVIFPEGGALALGVLGLRLPAWRESPVKLAVIPSAAAYIGIALTYTSLPRWGGELASLTAGFVLLALGRSRLTPSLSAGAFPLVFGIHTWVYPLTVLVICTALAVVAWLSPRSTTHASTGRLPFPISTATWAIAASWIILASPVLGLGVAAVAPPLFVGMVERLASADRSALTGLRHWIALVAAAAAGAYAAAGLPTGWVWVGGLVAVVAVLLVFAVVSGPHPPALAVCLIPQVILIHDPARYVADIALGAAVLYLAAGVLALVAPPHSEPASACR